MSTSPIQRLLRPAILLAAGILLGASALAVAAPSAPAATTQTRIASCAAFGFHPINSDTTYDWAGRALYRHGKDGDGWFMCPVDLPHRAVVTKVRVTVGDNSANVSIANCGLIRTSIGTTGSIEVVGLALAYTGLEPKPGFRRFTTTDIQRGTVDNGRFAYFFQCRIEFHPGLFEYGGDGGTGIVGADATYRISSADG